jgi:hypothetical protein
LQPNFQQQPAENMNNPPPVASATAQPFLDDAYDGQVNTPRTRSGRASKRLKAAHTGHAVGNVSTRELGEQAAFAVNQALLADPNAAAIPGAAGILVVMAQGFAQLNKRFDNMEARFDNMEARWKNSTVHEGTDRVSVVLLPNGNPLPALPLNFYVPGNPVTLQQFNALTPPQVLTMLQHYGLPNVPQATRMTRLRRHFGLPG